jgi:hypothetical protein
MIDLLNGRQNLSRLEAWMKFATLLQLRAPIPSFHLLDYKLSRRAGWKCPTKQTAVVWHSTILACLVCAHKLHRVKITSRKVDSHRYLLTRGYLEEKEKGGRCREEKRSKSEDAGAHHGEVSAVKRWWCREEKRGWCGCAQT